jgi:ribonuclease D
VESATIPTVLDELAPEWIDDAAGVERVAVACRETGAFALDTEADSLHSYFHKTCLVQVSANGSHFVIDPLALDTGALDPLWQVCADPAIPVLMHGSDYDVRVLDRDYGARIAGLRDSQLVAQLVGEPKTGLAALLDLHLGVTLDKKHQRADWGKRPLTDSMLNYAAADTAFLHQLVEILRNKADELGRWSWALEEFRAQEAVRHTEPEVDPLAFERVKGVRALKGAARDRAHALFVWRDETARGLDVPPFKVMGNRALVVMAEHPPESPKDMAAVDGLGPRFVRRWGRTVHDVLDAPGEAPPRQRHPRRPGLEPEVKERVTRLLTARDSVATELGIEGGLLCSRALAVDIALSNGGSVSAQTLRDGGLDGWRLEVLGDVFAKALAEE